MINSKNDQSVISLLEICDSLDRDEEELFTHNTTFPDKNTKIFIWSFIYVVVLIGSIINTLIVKVFPTDNKWIGLTFVLTFTVLIIPWGIFSGWLWEKTGEWLSNYLILNSLSQLKQQPQSKGNWIRKLIIYSFGGDINQFFLQLETKDVDFSNVKAIFRSTLKILLLYIAMLTILLKLISKQLINLLNQSLSIEITYALTFFFCFAVALSILALYLPFSIILDDTRLMIMHKNGSIKYTLSKVRNYIDGIFGLSGIISGYSLIRDLPGFVGFVDDQPKVLVPFIIFITFLVIVVLSTILAVPIIFPALNRFYMNYSTIINDFRDRILEFDIPIAVTSAIIHPKILVNKK